MHLNYFNQSRKSDESSAAASISLISLEFFTSNFEELEATISSKPERQALTI